MWSYSATRLYFSSVWAHKHTYLSKPFAILTPLYFKTLSYFWVISTSWILDFCLNFTGMVFFIAGKGQDSIMWMLLKRRTNSHPGQEDKVMDVEDWAPIPTSLLWLSSGFSLPPWHQLHPTSLSHCPETAIWLTHWAAAKKCRRYSYL